MRNKFDGVCYRCGAKVLAGTGHPELMGRGTWRITHAKVPGRGRVTCEMAAKAAERVVDRRIGEVIR